MHSLLPQLESAIRAAMTTAFGETARPTDPLVRPAGDPKFGDYQCNVAMSLAKKLGAKPREVAQKIIDALTTPNLLVRESLLAPAPPLVRESFLAPTPTGIPSGVPLSTPIPFTTLCHPPEIAGPGFINLRLKDAFLSAQLTAIPAPENPTADPVDDCSADRLGIPPLTPDDPTYDTVVIDYSSPNVAKQMHVGHLRSTIIGDTLARTLEFQGNKVIPQNHIGDWGTQFGIILEELFDRKMLVKGAAKDSLETRNLPNDSSELESIYRAGNSKMSDPVFADRARAAVTRLQREEPDEMLAWSTVVYNSMNGALELYKQLGVRLQDDRCDRGESFYNPLLAPVVAELRTALPMRVTDPSRAREEAVGNATKDNPHPANHPAPASESAQNILATWEVNDSALCVFLHRQDGSPAFKGPEGDPVPMIVQKSDGAFLYASTDLAAAAFRINNSKTQLILFKTDFNEALLSTGAEANRLHLNAFPPTTPHAGLGGSRLLYVVGSPQKLHFEMLFATVRALGWTRPLDPKTNQPVPREVRLEHVAFGSVLGEDRKMLRTRSGENVKLKDLLDEAIVRAEKLLRDTESDPEKRRGFSDDEIKNIAKTVGIAAVKYADLSQNRSTDYVFSWDKMLALQGNTAPYLLYAYARIRSIHRKSIAERPNPLAEGKAATLSNLKSQIFLTDPAERALALAILRLPETINAIAVTLLPNILCDYLYDLAGRFMQFYESCPVLQADSDDLFASRLRLCDLAARTLRLGLALLGIRTLDRM